METQNNIISAVKNAGVVGAGGAGFPTHVKISRQVNVAIANGAECEPLLKVDQQLMSLYPDKVLKGLELVMDATGAKQGVIALKEKYKDAVEALRKAIKGSSHPIELFFLGNYYPAGDEQDLVCDVTGRIVPEGGIPLDVGVVVDNVGTLINIAEAVHGIPVTHRVLTVGGAVNKPVTVSVPIGTSVQEVIELAGGIRIRDYVIIDGGPMMGRIVEDTSSPVTKTTSGILVLPGDLSFIKKKRRNFRADVRRAKSVCDQCFECTIVCPRYLLGHSLEPHRVMRMFFIDPDLSRYRKKETFAFLCSQCGLCDFYACPTDLSPKNIFRELRTTLVQAGVKNPHHKKLEQPREVREGRRVSVSRLISRLGIREYEHPAKFQNVDYEPGRVRIPLNQHIGAPSRPVVKAGDNVKKGDLIGELSGTVSTRVHASMDGRVTYVNSYIEIEK